MILSTEEREAVRDAMSIAWMGTTSVGAAVGAMVSLLHDAEQAQHLWATEIMQEAMERGLAEMLKRHRTSCAPRIETRRGDVATVVGAKVRTETGSRWGQMELTLLTREQLLDVIGTRRRNRDGANRDLVALGRLSKLMARNPSALTVGEALDLEHTTLDVLLAEETAA